VACNINPKLTRLPEAMTGNAKVPLVNDPETGEALSDRAPKEEKMRIDYGGMTELKAEPQPMCQGP